MKRMMWWSVIAAAGWLASACGEGLVLPVPAEAPQVEVLAFAVTRGNAVDVRLSNPGDRAWDYHLCAAARLQRSSDGAWVDAPTPLMICTMDLPSLGPGQVSSGRYGIPLGIPTGVHRVLVDFWEDGRAVRVPSNSFLVN